jgi:hypothetical protein
LTLKIRAEQEHALDNSHISPAAITIPLIPPPRKRLTDAGAIFPTPILSSSHAADQGAANLGAASESRKLSFVYESKEKMPHKQQKPS